MKLHDLLHLFKFLFFSILFFCNSSFGQGPGGCSENIGFELGTLDRWECFSGGIDRAGVIAISPTAPVSDRHQLLKNSYPQVLDPFGGFPINCPNGSGYSVRLGNSQIGSGAEQLSYTFTVPANQPNYSIIYNYAVVLENPSHSDYQQPKFTSKVFDVTSGQYVQCGSFEFVASASLPGFKLSPNRANVFYKPWSPITVNLYGYAGKTIRIEFTSNDCTLGGHFGYAYLDVNENCSSPISGGVYCNGANSLNLTAPFGFKEYRWFNSDFSQVLRTENVLRIAPPPAPGTNYQLEIVPFPGLGCLDTLSTTVAMSPESFNLKVVDTVIGCVTTGVDLTAPNVTIGSSPGLQYSYFADINQTEYVPTPKVVTKSGLYYIKAVNNAGCNDIKPIRVLVTDPPKVVITNPTPTCAPNTVDLTRAISPQSDPGLKYTYWKDAAATIPLLSPKAVDNTGLYLIRGEAPGGCAKLMPVSVTIGTLPDFTMTSATECGKVDITSPSLIVRSEPGLTYTYWQDAAASVDVPKAKAVTATGNYYVKATNVLGCSTIQPLQATVNPYPSFVANPITVTYPATADLTSAVVNTGTGTLKYSYWRDQQITAPLVSPKRIDANGTYYVRAKNELGCIADQPLTVKILAPPDPRIVAPTAFSPNRDGINDVFRVGITGEVSVRNMKVYNRWGQVVFETLDINKFWDGTYKGQTLPIGTYYWVFEGIDKYKEVKMISSGSVTILK